MKFFLVTLVLFSSANARAFTHEDEVHLAAHMGMSYALDTFFYGFNTRVLNLNKTNGEILAAVESLGIGFLYKYGEDADSASTEKSMLENTLGVGLSISTHIVFHF